jgi:hypothetical protein
MENIERGMETTGAFSGGCSIGAGAAATVPPVSELKATAKSMVSAPAALCGGSAGFRGSDFGMITAVRGFSPPLDGGLGTRNGTPVQEMTPEAIPARSDSAMDLFLAAT